MNEEIRNITHHTVSGDTAPQLEVRSVDAVGSGGAYHKYEIIQPNLDKTSINFQNGPIKEAGVNGISAESLMAIVIDRLECFQAGPFACAENDHALTYARVTLEALKKRTRDRIARQVEGTNQK